MLQVYVLSLESTRTLHWTAKGSITFGEVEICTGRYVAPKFKTDFQWLPAIQHELSNAFESPHD